MPFEKDEDANGPRPKKAGAGVILLLAAALAASLFFCGGWRVRHSFIQRGRSGRLQSCRAAEAKAETSSEEQRTSDLSTIALNVTSLLRIPMVK